MTGIFGRVDKSPEGMAQGAFPSTLRVTECVVKTIRQMMAGTAKFSATNGARKGGRQWQVMRGVGSPGSLV
jgi:hypothetical protein